MKIINTGVPLSKWKNLVRADDYQRSVLLPLIAERVASKSHILPGISDLQDRTRSVQVYRHINLWLHKMDERRRADIIASWPVIASENENSPTASAQIEHPELYMRIQVTKGAKGEYRGETSVHVTHRGTVEEIAEITRYLIQAADREYRYEVERREHVDAGLRSEA